MYHVIACSKVLLLRRPFCTCRRISVNRTSSLEKPVTILFEHVESDKMPFRLSKERHLHNGMYDRMPYADRLPRIKMKYQSQLR